MALAVAGSIALPECLALIASHEGLARHGMIRDLHGRVSAAMPAMALMSQLVPVRSHSHLTPEMLAPMVWLRYQQTLAHSQTPLTQVGCHCRPVARLLALLHEAGHSLAHPFALPTC